MTPDVDILPAITQLGDILNRLAGDCETLAATRRHLIRQARRQGHTLQQIADATGLDISRISRLEHQEG